MQDKAGFTGPAKPALPGRGTNLTAFESVGGAATGAAAANDRALGGIYRASGGAASLMDSVPAAIDVSGIGALTATGLGGGGGGNTAKAAAAAAAAARATGKGSSSGGGGSGKQGKPAGGLLGLLQSSGGSDAPGPQAAVDAGRPVAAVAGAGGANGSGAAAGGLTAALETLAAAPAGAGGNAVRPQGAGVGATRPGVPLPSRPPPLPLGHALGGQAGQLSRLTGLGAVGGGGGSSSGASASAATAASVAVGDVVVGPRRRVEEHRRRVESGEGSGSQPTSPSHGSQGGGGGAGGLTTGGLTRIVLHPVQPAVQGNQLQQQGMAAGDLRKRADAGTGEEGGVGEAEAAAAAGGPAGTGAGAGAGAGAPDLKGFLEQLKADLSPEAYKQFQRLMAAYK